MRRWPLALILAAALLLGISTTASARTDAGITPKVFTDPAGDSGTAADITTIGVTNDAAGAYTVDVVFATPLVSTSLIDLYLDTDLSAATGDPQSAGADYAIEDNESDQSFGFYKWDGTTFAPVQPVAISVSTPTDNKGIEFKIGAADIGSSKAFNFFLTSIEGDGSAGHFDDAPSGSGTFGYELQTPLTLTLAAAHASAVKAGGTWVLGLVAVRSDTGDTLGSEGTIVCSATAGSTKLTTTTRAFISTGGGNGNVAVCGFKVPKKLKGKTLHGTVKVSYQGLSVTKAFTTKVK
jgi:hypothetical protein